MAETVTLGTWNALNSFGDERARGALEVVKWMDADVVAFQEFTLLEEAESDRSQESQETLRKLGYAACLVAEYTSLPGERNAHTMSLWSRVNNEGEVWRQMFGTRYGLGVTVPGFGEAVALHLPDDSPGKRTAGAQAVIERQNLKIAFGDLNDMDRSDPRSRLPRTVDLVARHLPVDGYYDDSKRLQRLMGKVQRVGGMARGEAMQVFMDANFRDADPMHIPTIGKGLLSWQVDRILTRPGVEVERVDVLPRELTEGKDFQLISDHSPVVARLKS